MGAAGFINLQVQCWCVRLTKRSVSPVVALLHASFFLFKIWKHDNAGARTSQARGFASKFYDILSQESSDIITWTESGQAFQVLDYTRFSEEILLKVRSHVGKNANSSNHAPFFCRK